MLPPSCLRRTTEAAAAVEAQLRRACILLCIMVWVRCRSCVLMCILMRVVQILTGFLWTLYQCYSHRGNFPWLLVSDTVTRNSGFAQLVRKGNET